MNYKKTLSSILASLIILTGCSKEKTNSYVENDAEVKETIESVEVNTNVEKETITEEVFVEPKIEEKEVMYLGYIKDNAMVYDDTLETNITSEIEKYQKILITKESDYHYFIEDESQLMGYIKKDYVEILPEMFVEVDISSQTVNFYLNNELYMNTACVTGNGGVVTRLGYFEITYKAYDTYLKGPGYKSHVYFWMPFDQGIGLHDADGWRSEYGGDIYLTNGSHGCINMPFEAAETIYNNVDAGTKVLVHK